MPGRFEVVLTREADQDLDDYGAAVRKMVLDQLARHLTVDADDPRGKRKKVDRPNPFGAWRLMAYPYRAYYDIEERIVWVNAVLYKPRETAYRRGRKVEVDD
jgi:mRNA-degrading endonuclease RelE of RelBE toxin-antitoxin system